MTTATVACDERVDYWRESLKNMFRAECFVEPVHGSRFSAGMGLSNFGAINLVDIYGSAFNIRRHGLADQEKAYVLLQIDGHCEVRQEGRAARLSPGDMCLLPVGEEMAIERHDDFRQISINLPRARLSELCPDWEVHATRSLATNFSAGQLFSSTVKSLLECSDKIEAGGRNALGNAVMCMLGAVLDTVAGQAPARATPATQPSNLEAFHRERIRRFIRENLRRPDLDALSIAEGVGLSPRYIHRLFEQEPMRLMHWVWEQRLTNCQQDLAKRRESKHSISQIAYAWGFNDQAHFSRAFRKRFGIAPSSV